MISVEYVQHIKEMNELCKSPNTVEITRFMELRWRENAARKAKARTA